MVAVVRHNGMVLVGRKRSDSKKRLAGEWHFIGENVEGNESDYEALKRGLREEVGIDIRVEKLIGKDQSPTGKDVCYYECFSVSGGLKVGSDLEAARWVDEKKVLEYLGSTIKQFMRDQIMNYLRGIRS